MLLFAFMVWLQLAFLLLMLFFGGGGKIPKLMRDMGQGINAFKKGLKEEDKEKAKADADGRKPLERDTVATSRVEEKDKAASG